MSEIVVSYDDVENVAPGYLQRLKEKEHAVRQAMAKLAGYMSVRWTETDGGAGHTLFAATTRR